MVFEVWFVKIASKLLRRAECMVQWPAGNGFQTGAVLQLGTVCALQQRFDLECVEEASAEHILPLTAFYLSVQLMPVRSHLTRSVKRCKWQKDTVSKIQATTASTLRTSSNATTQRIHSYKAAGWTSFRSLSGHDIRFSYNALPTF